MLCSFVGVLFHITSNFSLSARIEKQVIQLEEIDNNKKMVSLYETRTVPQAIID